MRLSATLAVALLLAGCGLVAPFDLTALPGVEADADGDADEDAEADEDVEATPDRDLEADAEDAGDADPWNPLAGCSGSSSDEKWLVLVSEDYAPVTYLTGRGCADPVRLCRGCYATSISPDGSRALVLEPAEVDWRLEDRIGVVPLEGLVGPDPEIDWLGLEGANPVWVDDGSFVYVAVGEPVEPPCEEREVPERTLLRLYESSSEADHEVGGHVGRAWVGGFPAPSEALGLVAFGDDLSRECGARWIAVNVRDLESGEGDAVDWTTGSRIYFPVGMLPCGSGFLVQMLLASPAATSALYAASYHADAVPLIDDIPSRRSVPLIANHMPGFWPDCGAARRIGPACELYCRENETGLTYRYVLTDLEVPPELVECPTLEGAFRIMDIWQI